jgi:RimJ/RimL family protein N-acetyltransferase
MNRLDLHWAAHLGCSTAQLRDGGRHIVARPADADGTPPPWPLRRGPVALVTTGKGWVLSAPSEMAERARAMCAALTFAELVVEGDRLAQEWFDGGGSDNPNMKRAEVEAGYRVMNDLVQGISLRGWAHYILSYADALVPASEHSANVIRISPDHAEIWEQFLKWPGPMCGPKICEYFPVSDAFGYVLDGELVSAAQLEARHDELEWEYGVDTLPQYRCRGFGTAVVKVVTDHIVQEGHIPWHYAGHYNRASLRLPKKLGYFQYGEGLFSVT